MNEGVCKSADDEYELNEQDLNADAQLEGCLDVLWLLLVASKQKDDPQVHHESVFQKGEFAGTVCSLVINTRRYTDVISEEVIYKLGL